MYRNAFSAGSPSRIPPAELTALPRPTTELRGGGKGGREGNGKGEGRGGNHFAALVEIQ